MSFDVPTAQLVAFLLAGVRAAAWLVVVPPFNTRAIPAQVKVALAMGLALPVTPQLAAHAPSTDVAPLVQAVAMQVAAGLALGVVVLVLVAAVETAGSLIDLFGGFSMSQAYDPMGSNQNTVIARMHQMVAVTLLFAVNGHLLLLNGFLRSYQAMPLDGHLALNHLARVLTHDVSTFFLAALQIAAPLVAVSFVADLGLGLLTRAAPALNIFSLGFPVKVMLTLVLVGSTFAMLPNAVTNLLHTAVQSIVSVAGGG